MGRTNFVELWRAAESGGAVIKVLGKRSGKLWSIASTLTLNLGLHSSWWVLLPSDRTCFGKKNLSVQAI